MKSREEIEQLAREEYKDNLHNPFFTAAPMGYIRGYTQCQEDMADKIKEAVNLLNKLVENTELFFGYDVANKNSNIRNAKSLINSLNKQD